MFSLVMLALLGQVPHRTLGPVAPQLSSAATTAQWIWVSNEARYGWGKINAAGYFIPEPLPSVPQVVTPEPAKAAPGEVLTGDAPNYGIEIEALHRQANNTFTTNDPDFRPNGTTVGQQVPIPTGGVTKGPPTFIYASGGLVALLVFLGLYERRKNHS